MSTYNTRTIRNYPDNGKHKEIVFDLGNIFEIRKGEDGYGCIINNKDYNYNLGKTTTKLWIINLVSGGRLKFNCDFNIRVSRDPQKLIDYAYKFYENWLNKELKKIKEYRA